MISIQSARCLIRHWNTAARGFQSFHPGGRKVCQGKFRKMTKHQWLSHDFVDLNLHLSRQNTHLVCSTGWPTVWSFAPSRNRATLISNAIYATQRVLSLSSSASILIIFSSVHRVDYFNVFIFFWTILPRDFQLTRWPTTISLGLPMSVCLPHVSQHPSSLFVAAWSFFSRAHERNFNKGSVQNAIECTYVRLVVDLAG